MIVGTHRDKLEDDDGALEAKLAGVTAGVAAWQGNMAKLAAARHEKMMGKRAGVTEGVAAAWQEQTAGLKIQLPILPISSREMNPTIDAAFSCIQELVFNDRLFPAFLKEIPLTYERVRAFCTAVALGGDCVAAVKSGRRTTEQVQRETFCFVPL